MWNNGKDPSARNLLRSEWAVRLFLALGDLLKKVVEDRRKAGDINVEEEWGVAILPFPAHGRHHIDSAASMISIASPFHNATSVLPWLWPRGPYPSLPPIFHIYETTIMEGRREKNMTIFFGGEYKDFHFFINKTKLTRSKCLSPSWQTLSKSLQS